MALLCDDEVNPVTSVGIPESTVKVPLEFKMVSGILGELAKVKPFTGMRTSTVEASVTLAAKLTVTKISSEPASAILIAMSLNVTVPEEKVDDSTWESVPEV